MQHAVFITLFLPLVSFSSHAQDTFQAEDWKRAERNIKRLKADKFPQLPVTVREYLSKSACSVPQPYGARPPQNVISGYFTGSSEKDWAVLCSRNGVSSILVFRHGDSVPFADLARQHDFIFLQGLGLGQIGFSRIISVATPQGMRAHFAYRGWKPPRISHEGIDDSFEDKASTVYYFARGKWLTFPGSD
ncbi:MAG TPA: hypothetical protein VGS96_16060 [Thermoanaerobaculia bacterium]|jgi:hypothetical protein|nr:hypothetical protein [Thermoanaerobaculia bacterium]